MANDLFNVRGKSIVVTGGLGRLGRQFALGLLDRGARVAVLDVAADAPTVAQRYGDHRSDPNLMFLAADVTRRQSLEQALAAVKAQWGVPWGLMNNAAIDAPPNAPATETGPFETYPESSFDRVMDVNVKGVVLCCQVFGGAMAEAAGGSIVNISSIYGLVSPDQRIYEYRRSEGDVFVKPVAYSVSKSALMNLARYLATYWASKNVRVNTLTLGGVFDNQNERFLKGYCAKVPLGRMARPDEYVGAAVFLLSEASSYMTGANLVMDGGLTAW